MVQLVLSRGLLRLGHEVRVVTFHSERPGRNDETEIEGVRVGYLPWLGWGTRQFPRNAQLLTRAVAESDVVHSYGLYNLICPLAFRRARQAGRPCILEPLGMYKPKAASQAIKRLYHRFFTGRMFQQAERVIATSNVELEELRQAVLSEKLVVRPNGINPDEFKRLPPREAFRKRLGLPLTERVILFLGRISPIKNLEMLVRAFARAGLPRTTLVLAGPALEPDYLAQVRRTIDSCQASERVLLPGSVDGEDKLAALAAADLFVLPSQFESFGNAAAEAVAAGLPVLVTEGCGIARQIHERAGLSVPCDEADLSEGLRRLSSPAEANRLMGRRAEVLGELSWDEPLRQMDKIYRQLGQDGAGPGSKR